jgi:peptidoglycan/LPS O-acetylase OafA/YrhL
MKRCVLLTENLSAFDSRKDHASDETSVLALGVPHPAGQRLPAVDGLRALAVLAVVLFHSFPSLITGGFVGVDIFFVISGFVIALRYLEPMVSRKISFTSFYVKRIRRLLPAYIVLLLVSTALAIIFLPPRDLVNYGIGLVGQSLHAQNITFWHIGDYFDDPLSKPLLHTWSLAVEEQFYFIFPLAILLLRWRVTLTLALLAIVGLVSIGAGSFIGTVSPKTAFYFLPFRVWELLAGFFVAIAYQRHLSRFGGKFSTVVVIAGLIMMSAAIVLFRETSRESNFPGTQSMLAVTGCMLVCLFHRSEAVATRVLTNSLAQHFGRISYSWYLWHWPPLCFFFILEGHSPDFVPALCLMLLGYGLAVASYTTFETWGLRTYKLKSAHIAFAMLGAFLVLTGGTGALLLREDGLLFRYPKGKKLLYAAQMDTVSYRCPLLRRLAAWRDEICQLNDTKKAGGVLIVGDSFADQAKTAIVSLGNENDVAIYMTKQNCQILDYFVHNKEKAYCSPSQWESIQKDITKMGITRLVAISHWPLGTDAFERSLEQLSRSKLEIFIQLATPESPLLDPQTRLAEPYGQSESSRYSAAEYRALRQSQNDFLNSFALTHVNVTILDPVPELCGGGICSFARDQQPLYIDGAHLTQIGVSTVLPIYNTIFKHGNE